ncbi:MAG: glutaredoxin 3 [Alphaproteobacteria bacterium]|jgi:glutaredoxin 3|nr:glutaredoxin 3 [Alphaproteobacteria bacterium]MDP6565535.1 glutaredoxin 3 [Alphaproteobacteria bacterium]MDP6812074.1 glutaredoxin 3 [Alphaproteobacteria bacterium]
MPDVTIYTTAFCPFCFQAKKLLGNKGVAYREIDVDAVPGARAEMMQRAGGRHTVPQIFIGERHIGGCDELFELDYDDELDPLLGLAAAP